MTIPIYKQEQIDGVAKAIASQKSIAYVSQARVSENFETDINRFKGLARQSDYKDGLYPLDSILVTVGCNRNDDAFLPKYAWAARNTPVDKPVNFMHNESDIIGHMTASLVIDADNNIVDDSLAFDEIPDFFHIVVASVLYKDWDNEEKQERMDKIIAEMPDNKWFVSMECLFRDFDYGLVTEEGNKVVARNSETAFLTKHLRAFGGTGQWQGQRLFRVLKDFYFSGKGLVDNPANPESIIFNEIESPFSISKAAITVASINQENNNNMADTNDKVIADLQAKIEKLESEREANIVKAQEGMKAQHEAEVAALNETLKSQSEKLAQFEADVAASKEEFEKLTKEFASIKEEKDGLSDKLQSLEAAKALAERSSQLVVAGLDKEAADKVAERWASASDEQFADIVALHKKEEVATASVVTDETQTETDTVTEDLEEASASTLEGSSVLDSETDLEEELSKAAASWIKQLL